MNIFLSPSLLSADFTRVGEQLSLLEEAGVPYLHLDVMDGIFVPNISFGMPVIQSIRKASKMVFDVHLMITEPERYAEEFAKAGADIVNFHVEATQDIVGTIQKIRFLGKKVGITISPETPASAVEPYLKLVDMVLVMTVEPGFAGQKFMPEQVEKIRRLAEWKKELGFAYDIEVDGGVTLENVRTSLDAGANIIVAGSAVLGKADIAGAAGKFLEIFKEYE